MFTNMMNPQWGRSRQRDIVAKMHCIQNAVTLSHKKLEYGKISVKINLMHCDHKKTLNHSVHALTESFIVFYSHTDQILVT